MGAFNTHGPATLGEYRREFKAPSFYYGNACSALKDFLAAHRDRAEPGRTTVLVPAYICANVVSALYAIDLTVEFYPVGEDCRVDPSDVDRLCGTSTLAVLWVHFFGTTTELSGLREIVEGRGALLIEDCAHVIAGRAGDSTAGTMGHAAVFSLWKTLQSADGALLVLNRGCLESFVPRYTATSGEHRAILAITARVLKRGVEVLAARPLPRPFTEPTPPFAINVASTREEGISAISRSSRIWLERQDLVRILRTRRRNFQEWTARLQLFPTLSPLFTYLESGWVPFSFPVRVRGRDRLRSFLWRNGVPCGAGFPEASFADDQNGALSLAASILELPVHQSFTPRAMNYACALLRRWELQHPGSEKRTASEESP